VQLAANAPDTYPANKMYQLDACFLCCTKDKSSEPCASHCCPDNFSPVENTECIEESYQLGGKTKWVGQCVKPGSQCPDGYWKFYGKTCNSCAGDLSKVWVGYLSNDPRHCNPCNPNKDPALIGMIPMKDGTCQSVCNEKECGPPSAFFEADSKWIYDFATHVVGQPQFKEFPYFCKPKCSCNIPTAKAQKTHYCTNKGNQSGVVVTGVQYGQSSYLKSYPWTCLDIGSGICSNL